MKLEGTGVAIVTPFQKNREIDEPALRKLVDYQINNGVNFLVVQGSTGEAATLSEKEKKQVLEIVIDQNKGKLPVVLGLSGNSTTALATQYANFDAEGVAAFLCATPHYNKPSQSGIIAHYKAISSVAKRPIILYNVPGRTAINMTANTILTLAEEKNIIGVKEASGDLTQVMDILQDAPADFSVISGEDGLTMPIMAMGGKGVISVVANAFPKHYSTMVDAMLEGDLETAKKEHYLLLNITKTFFEEGNPSGVKYALYLLKISQEFVRLPLTPISEKLKIIMKKELNKIPLRN